MISPGAEWAWDLVEGFNSVVGKDEYGNEIRLNHDLKNDYVHLGIGIGNLFGYLTNNSEYPYSKGVRSSPDFIYWQEAITYYNGDSGYLESVMSIWTTGVYIWTSGSCKLFD